MNDKEVVFNLRKRIFEDWRWKRYAWQEAKAKYGFSKKWFYKWLKRFLKHGDEELKNIPRIHIIVKNAEFQVTSTKL